MKNKENKVSETQPEKKRVAATLEGAQPRPNTSAAQTAQQIGAGNNFTRWTLAYVPKLAETLIDDTALFPRDAKEPI